MVGVGTIQAKEGGNSLWKKISAIRGFVAILMAFFWLLPSVGNADPHKLTCGKEKTIGEALHELKPGDTLLVSGTCNENLVIPEEVHRITLDGQGTATINGGPPVAVGQDTILVRGTGITIKGFNVTGGQNGIQVNRGGTATIDGNTVQNAGRQGIQINNRSFATIINNTVTNNTTTGIQLIASSAADIGFVGNPDNRTPSPNIIQGNGGDGINLGRTSHADIAFNTISNNGGRGIRVAQTSTARIGGLSNTGPSGNTISGNGSDGIRVNGVSQTIVSENTINNNGGNGIRVEENSGVNLNVANTTTVNNGGRGLRCLIGAYARGSLGTLNGNAGQTSFDATCINATTP